MDSERSVVPIALIGAGRMGRVHLEALERSELVGVAGVVEPIAQAREAMAARGHRTYATVDQLLADQRPAGVLIAAPSDLHLELIRRVADESLPTLCEKPLGVRVSDAIQAADAAGEAGVLLQVGYWRRFVPELRTLRARIAAGELGEVSLVACHQWDELPPSDQFRAHSGGIAVDMAVHEFDQTRWLTGREVEWVAAASGSAASPLGQASGVDPDVAAILAQLSGGAAAAISLGRRFPHGDCCWLEVFGTGGFQRVQFMWGPEADRVFRSAVLAQLESFAAAISGEEQVGAGGEDAIAALTAAQLAGEALAEGRSRALATTVSVQS